MSRSHTRIAVTVTMALALGLRAPVTAQDVRVALTTDSARVGDLVGVAVQIDLPPTTILILPDTLELAQDLENAARKQVRVDSLANGSLRYLITYPITAWRPGTFQLASIAATLTERGAQRTLDVQMPALNILSVLPPDTTNIEAKPPRDVWGASRIWWPIILIALLVLAAAAALYWWWRRRKRRAAELPAAPAVPAVLPREWILRELERVERSGTIERGDFRRYYIELSDVLRRYVAMIDGYWGADLTTGELDRALARAGADGSTLISLLNRADLVKFARHDVGANQARSDLSTARQWAGSFEKPVALAEAA